MASSKTATSDLLLPHTSTFPFLLFNSLTFLLKNKFSLSWLYLTSSSASHLLNSLTFSSPQLITSPFHLPLSHSHLLNSLISSSPQAPPICYSNFMLRFCFLVSIWSLSFESERCVLSLLIYDWLWQVSCFYLFIYLVFLFCLIFLFFGFWCSLVRWFYHFLVPKLFSSNVLD